MNPHLAMQKRLRVAAEAIHPALAPSTTRTNEVGSGSLVIATTTIERLLRSARGPTAAVYITWDMYGTCRYVGSVHRSRDRQAVRRRMADHMRVPDRRMSWYAVSVLGLRTALPRDLVRECEGIVARRLSPVDGTAHPIPSTESTLTELVARVSARSEVGLR